MSNGDPPIFSYTFDAVIPSGVDPAKPSWPWSLLNGVTIAPDSADFKETPVGKKSSLSAEERVAMLRERWKLGNRQQRAKFPERERQRYRDWYAANRDEWNAIRRQRYAERKAAKE